MHFLTWKMLRSLWYQYLKYFTFCFWIVWTNCNCSWVCSIFLRIIQSRISAMYFIFFLITTREKRMCLIPLCSIRPKHSTAIICRHHNCFQLFYLFAAIVPAGTKCDLVKWVVHGLGKLQKIQDEILPVIALCTPDSRSMWLVLCLSAVILCTK